MLRIYLERVLSSLVLLSFAGSALAAGVNDGLQMLGVENYSGALQQFEISLQKNPNDAESTANIAKVYLAKGDNKNGVQWALKATKLAPSNSDYNLLLGHAYARYINDVGFFSKLSVTHKIEDTYQNAVEHIPNFV